MVKRCLVAALSMLWAVMFITGCKENTIISADALNQNEAIGVLTLPDTLTMLSKTLYDDSIVTSGNKSTTATQIEGIGRLNDYPMLNSDMGNTNAYTYLQVVAPATNYKLDTAKYVYDSIVMVLPYLGFTYGDTTATSPDLQYSVYRLSERLSIDSTYYSNHPPIAHSTTLLGNATVPVSKLSTLLKDSITVQGRKEPYHLRIPLAQSFLDSLTTKTNTAPADSQPAFLDWLKGFLISPNTTDFTSRAIPYWRLNGGDNIYTRAGLVLYYHTKGQTDTLRDNFPYNGSYAAHFNKIERLYSPGTLAAQLLNSTLPSDSLVFLQNEPGGAIDIKMPFVKNLPKGIINKAELIITEDPAHLNALFATPSRMYPYLVENNGNLLVLADRLPIGSEGGLSFIDGNRKLVVVNTPTGSQVVSQYTINIPRELQRAIVEQRDTLHLRLNGTVTFPGAYRVVAGGRNHSNPSIRLRMNIVYSQLQ